MPDSMFRSSTSQKSKNGKKPRSNLFELSSTTDRKIELHGCVSHLIMCSLLALDRVAEVVKAYKEMIQEIPNDTFPDIYAKIGLAATKAAAGVLPDLMEKVFLPIIQNQYRRAFQADYLQHSLLKDIDRSTVDDLIYRYTPPVVRCMEEVLDALENMAMDTSM